MFQEQFVGSTFVLNLIFSKLIGVTYGQRIHTANFDIVLFMKTKNRWKIKYLFLCCTIEFLCKCVESYELLLQRKDLLPQIWYYLFNMDVISVLQYILPEFMHFLFPHDKNLLVWNQSNRFSSSVGLSVFSFILLTVCT